MSLLRAKITIPRDTGLPEDVSVNTFHFSTTDTPSTLGVRLDIRTALLACYANFDQLLSSVNAPPATLTFYDLGEAEPRAPLNVETFPLTVDTGTSPIYPEEVAVCCSYSADTVSGENRARRRGRIFIGPVAPLGAIVNGRVRIASANVAFFVTGFTGLATASQASAAWSWVVYSPTEAAEAGPQDGWYAPVTRGWVDDAFDTQRRRGPAPTVRTSWVYQ